MLATFLGLMAIILTKEFIQELWSIIFFPKRAEREVKGFIGENPDLPFERM